MIGISATAMTVSTNVGSNSDGVAVFVVRLRYGWMSFKVVNGVGRRVVAIGFGPAIVGGALL